MGEYCWSNDGTSAVVEASRWRQWTLTVSGGLYSVLLGDVTMTHMTAIPASAA